MRSIQPTNSAASWDSMSTMWCAAASFSSVCTFCSKITDWWSTAHPRPRVHRKPHWPLQRSPVSCRWRLYPTIAVSSACCRAADHRRSDAKSTSHRHYVTLFTGWRHHSASPSQLRWWCSTVLAADVRSTLVTCTLLYTPLLLVCDCDQPTTVTSSSHAHGPLGLAAAVSACADQQFGTNLHRICKAQTLMNSLNVGLRAGYLSVRTAGGASDRRWLKARC